MKWLRSFCTNRYLLTVQIIIIVILATVKVSPALAENRSAINAIHVIMGNNIQALKGQPINGSLAPRLAGRLLILQGNYQSAKKNLEQASSIFPRDSIVQVELAETYYHIGEPEKALALWKRAGAYLQLITKGEQLAQAEKWSQAILFFEAAQDVDPKSPDTNCCQIQIGYMLERMARWQEADDLYQDFLLQFPDYPQAHIGLGRVFYYGELRLGDALAEEQRAIYLAPSSSDAYNTLGGIYKAEKQYSEALYCYHKAAELAPDNYWPIGSQADVLMAIGDSQSAIRLLEENATRFAKMPHRFFQLAMAYQQIGDVEKAIEAAQQSVVLDTSNNVGYLTNLGRMYEAGGYTAKAIAAYQDALRIDPTRPDALEALQRINK